MNYMIWFIVVLILLSSVVIASNFCSEKLREYEFNDRLLVFTENTDGKIVFGYDKEKYSLLNEKDTSKLLRSFENITRT